MTVSSRFVARSGVALVVCGLVVVGSQLALPMTSLASASEANRTSATAPDACTIVPLSRIGAALGDPNLRPKGSLNGGGTSSSCMFTHGYEQLNIEIYPASQDAQTVRVDTQLWGAPKHPTGLGSKGDYFYSATDGEATVLFVKGPFLGELLTVMGPTRAAVVAGAKRLVDLGPIVYSSLKA